MKKNILKIAAVCAMSALMMSALAGCGATKDKNDETTASAEKLIMATNAEFPPYEYHENDKIVGIDAEVAQAIADKLGMELEIEDMAFDSIIPAVQSGKASIGVAGMTVTEDRLVNVNFSDTYSHGKQVIIVKDDSPIALPDDLEGKKVGVQTSTTGDIYITDDYGDESVERYQKGADAIQALLQDKIDAVVIDSEPAKVFVSENEGLKTLDTPYVEEDYAIALAKDNTELLDKINSALAELKQDGTLDKIINKYITSK